MVRCRHRRRSENQQQQRPSLPAARLVPERVVVREAERVERLAYTRSQAAEALGISRSTFTRRLLPLIDTVQMPSGTRLIPVYELERLLAEQRQKGRARAIPGRPAPAGRKPGLPAEVIARIRRQRAAGSSLAEIACTLNSDNVPTSQGGRRWWPSTVHAVLTRPSPRDTAQAGPGHP